MPFPALQIRISRLPRTDITLANIFSALGGSEISPQTYCEFFINFDALMQSSSVLEFIITLAPKSEKDLAIAESDLKPTASLSLEKSYADDLSSTIDRKDKDILKATVSWPFYSGGKKKSAINKNTNLTARKRLL